MSKQKNPGILVVIATLGQRPEYMKKTLESIRAQKYKNLELVFVYPLTNKSTKKLAREYGAKSIDDPGSMSAAVNIGIMSASENISYVTWIGDDDLLEPKALHESIMKLEDNPNAVASYGYCNYINENGDILFTSRAGKIAPWLMTWGPNFVPLPGAVFRLDMLKSLDYIFDETLNLAMDLDLFLRLRKKGKLVNVGKAVSSFRWHSNSATVSGRSKSIHEAEQVKRRYYPRALKLFIPLWEIPVRIATHIAAKRVTKLAKSKI